MNFKNMSYGTLLLLVIYCIYDSIETKFKNLFVRKPKKFYQIFSGNVIATFPGLIHDRSYRSIESVSDNIRYDPISDIWEVFRVSYNDFNQNTEIHQGRRGYWIIVDDEQKISAFRKMFLEKTSTVCTPTIQM